MSAAVSPNVSLERILIGVPLNTGSGFSYLLLTFMAFFTGIVGQYLLYHLTLDRIPLQIEPASQYVLGLVSGISESSYLNFAGLAIAPAVGIITGFGLLWRQTRGRSETIQRFIGATVVAIAIALIVLTSIAKARSDFILPDAPFLLLVAFWVGRFMLAGLARRPRAQMFLSLLLGLLIEIGYHTAFESGTGEHLLSWMPLLLITSFVPWLPGFFEYRSGMENRIISRNDTTRAFIFRTLALAIWPVLSFFVLVRPYNARNGLGYDDVQNLIQAAIPGLIIALTVNLMLRVIVNSSRLSNGMLPGLVATSILAGFGGGLAFLASTFSSSLASFYRVSVPALQALIIGSTISYAILLFFSVRTGSSGRSHTTMFVVKFARASFYFALVGTVIAMWGRPFLVVALISALSSIIVMIASAIVVYIIVAPIWWADALGSTNR